jgi:hypothetical protein
MSKKKRPTLEEEIVRINDRFDEQISIVSNEINRMVEESLKKHEEMLKKAKLNAGSTMII